MQRRRKPISVLLPFVMLFAVAAGTSSGALAPATTGDASTGTFGRTTVGTMQQLNADRKRVSRFQLSEPAVVTHVSGYLDGNGSKSGSSQVIRFVVSGDTGGNPRALLAATATHAIAKRAAGAWVTLALSTPLTLAPGTYHLGIHSGATNGLARYAAVKAAGALAENPNSFAAGPSDPFGSITRSDQGLSIYATYTRVQPPVSTDAPVVSGVAQLGSLLSGSRGSWSGSPTEFAYV